jgi:hypothetical protein
MQLPGPVRAVVGLVATAADEAKRLPDRAIELPMLALSSALQMSMRAQQHYTRLAARGDDVIHRRPVSDDAPPWATFDEPVPTAEKTAPSAPVQTQEQTSDPAARAAGQVLDELLGTDESAPSVNGTVPPQQAQPKRPPAKRAPAKKAPNQEGKTINKPRHTQPSAFDAVDDDT